MRVNVRVRVWDGVAEGDTVIVSDDVDEGEAVRVLVRVEVFVGTGPVGVIVTVRVLVRVLVFVGENVHVLERVLVDV